MAKGFIKKRGDSWYAYWRDPAGKQKAKSFGPNKRDAELYLSEVQRDLRDHTYRDIKDITLSQYTNIFLRDYSAIRVKPSTQANHKSLINSSIMPFFGDIKLSAITPATVQRYVVGVIDSGRAPATALKGLMLMKTMMAFAVEWGYLKRNPAESVRPPRSLPPETDFLTPAEIRVFLDAVDAKWYPFFYTAIFTGMRLGELIGLEWNDIDWERSAIRVQRSVWNGDFQDPKTRNSRRAIGMSPSLETVLWDYKGWAQQNPHNLLFCTSTGNTLDAANVRKRVFYPTLDRAGLRRIRFHDLRHTYASLLINQGENLKYVQQQLGHASISTTVDRYGHLMPNIRHDASLKLDSTVFEAA